jgi:N6-adenosine-specific RNA methylase IME4
MPTDLIRIRGAEISDTGLVLPDNLSAGRWAEIGQGLGGMERAVGWLIGDWWNAGKRYGADRRSAIVQAPGWTGPAYKTCRNCGAVAARFPSSLRRDNLTFEHHRQAGLLPTAIGTELLAELAEKAAANGGHPPPATAIRQEWKRRQRAARQEGFVPPPPLGTFGRFDVIYADPPWQFETWSDNGMDRHAANHYPTMTTADIAAMAVQAAAADDCALFLWRTGAMMDAARAVMAAWGFAYKAEWIWLKRHAGTGYWQRNKHEVLMLGTRGHVPAPDPADRYDSVIALSESEHSVKPDGFAEMIEAMFPTQRLLEMFARSPRLGWTTWGNEIPSGVASPAEFAAP